MKRYIIKKGAEVTAFSLNGEVMSTDKASKEFFFDDSFFIANEKCACCEEMVMTFKHNYVPYVQVSANDVTIKNIKKRKAA